MLPLFEAHAKNTFNLASAATIEACGSCLKHMLKINLISNRYCRHSGMLPLFDGPLTVELQLLQQAASASASCICFSNLQLLQLLVAAAAEASWS
jgi:hypothetical protein